MVETSSSVRRLGPASGPGRLAAADQVVPSALVTYFTVSPSTHVAQRRPVVSLARVASSIWPRKAVFGKPVSSVQFPPLYDRRYRLATLVAPTAAVSLNTCEST